MKLRILIFFFLGNILLAKAQEKSERVSGEFVEEPFNLFINRLEAQVPYRFYYDIVKTRELTVSGSFKDELLIKALSEALKPLNLKYSIIDRNVFISSQEILAAIPDKFWENKQDLSLEPIKETQKEEKLIEINSELDNKLYVINSSDNYKNDKLYKISGRITDRATVRGLGGTKLYVENPYFETTATESGNYTISIPGGYHTLFVKSIGISPTSRKLLVKGDGVLNISLQSRTVELDEVLVSAKISRNVTDTRSGVEKINVKQIKQTPTAFGEADVIRVLLTLPGVKSVGEASTGFNVRGGSTDQNLIQYNDFTIYNPSHFFGFFSAFNADVVKDVELFKSSIPAKYGGRLSSVLNIEGKDGNNDKLRLSGGIGLLTSRLEMDGPIGSGKTTLIGSGRTTYSNWMLDLLPKSDFSGSKASFYDLNFGVKHVFDLKNQLTFSSYYSDDKFNLKGDTLYRYSNKNGALKYTHSSQKVKSDFTVSFSSYNYYLENNDPTNTNYRLDYQIEQFKAGADFLRPLKSGHELNYGISSIYYGLRPGNLKPIGNQSNLLPTDLEKEKGLETAFYLEDHYTVSEKFSMNYGIRFSLYSQIGPHSVNNYIEGVSKNSSTLISSTEKSGIIKTYGGPEYRLSMKYGINETTSIKGGFNSLRQYIHMISNTSAISPTDIWKLSDTYIKPQEGSQVSLGVYKNLKENTVETSIEVYYKKIKNYLDYKGGAQLVLNPNIEQDVLASDGKAYGVEFLIRKISGKLNGWLSYTYSRTLLKTDSPYPEEVVNAGKFYPSNYDKPHDMTLVGNYQLSQRFSVSLNFTYSTGRPITLPISKFNYGGTTRVLYSDRNKYRIPDTYRADVSVNILGSHKIKTFVHSSWSLGVYNVTGRKNPYSVYFDAKDGQVKGYQLSIFGSPIPFITYNFRF